MRSETYHSILDVLKKNKNGLTTLAIAKAINLSRSATSHYLNELLQSNEITQTGARPVYWLLASEAIELTGNVFQRFIGSDGSAQKAIEKCKAAVLYPPFGLPLLLHGASGVGKSFLAHLIFDYLQSQNAKCAEHFFVFNCADYANNPELLSSILFGHKKGAFTGAEKRKKGVLAQADGGLLFLDEVHRLSNENQEKLFQFMDTGQFRPIGEEEKSIQSTVRLLFATTENPREVLLPTFYRRISVMIDLPTFQERPIFERIELVNYLFFREAKRIERDITIDSKIIDQLTNEQLSGNIGSLANIIQMHCADALRRNPSTLMIQVGEADATESIQISRHFLEKKQKKDLFCSLNDSFMSLFNEAKDFIELKTMIYQFDHRYLEELFGKTENVLTIQIKKKIEEANQSILDNESLIEQPLVTLARILRMNQNSLPVVFLEKQKHKLSKKFPRTLLLSEQLTKNIDTEIRLLTEFLFAVLLAGEVSEDIRYQALLVAHGNTTASSIQAVANKMCGEYVFDAIDMPLTASIRDVITQVKRWLSKRDTSEGVIMLVDMGSLTHLYKSLKPQIFGELLVVNNLTTSYALEIGNQLINGSLFYEIAKSAEKNFKTSVQYFEGFSVEKNVIISSISGQDIAKRIKNICQKYFAPDIKLIVLNYKELIQTLGRASSDRDYLKETTLILTTSYLDNKTEVPSINLLDVLDDDAENQLNKHFKNLVHSNNVPMIMKEFIHFFSREGLSEKLEFLNPDVIICQVEQLIEKCENRFSLKLGVKMKFNLMMHLSLMIERTLLGAEDYPLPEDIQCLKIGNKLFYQNIKSIFHSLEQFYKIQISHWELFVLYEIITS